jgi:hypothetical protein
MFGDNAALRDSWGYGADVSAFPPPMAQSHGYATTVPSSYFLTSMPQASWLRDAMRKLAELASLPPNWDSYGGRPLSPEMRLAAGSLIAQIAEPGLPMPAIVPTSDGSIQLEWHERDIDLELRLRSQSVYELYFADASGVQPPIEEELRFDLRPLHAALEILRSR